MRKPCQLPDKNDSLSNRVIGDQVRLLAINQLDERLDRYRLAQPKLEQQMLKSLDYGQSSPVVVCQLGGQTVLFDGFSMASSVSVPPELFKRRKRDIASEPLNVNQVPVRSRYGHIASRPTSMVVLIHFASLKKTLSSAQLIAKSALMNPLLMGGAVIRFGRTFFG